jgi:lysophospholipid acyltransferase 1/2
LLELKPEDPEIQAKPLIYRILYCGFTAYTPRFNYYFAWNLADLVSNASGLGFNGYDTNGRPKWDLTSGFDFFKIEVRVL